MLGRERLNLLEGSVIFHHVFSGQIQANGVHQTLGNSDVELEVESYLEG